ncbi:hypothetical protein Zmor_022166 [Zophobas morio]|uniref:Invertebrate defensins family profile domain-containing protein n=1 Tax=Zophobas morio TaxID=2755281 RepID=A0AA38HVC8_9CUCU|nr:hypothetical protein Zmor_022166 [Zophobas morio]
MNTLTVVIIATFALICISQSNSLPLGEELSPMEDSQQGKNLAHIRVRRFTCDVLSAEAKGIKLNHSACAVHCLFRGKRGGHCNRKRVCVCR